MKTEYVPIEDRVRTLMTRIEIELNDPRREIIVETLQRLAEDVRKRCADEANALAGPEERIPSEIRAIFEADPEAACRNLIAAVQRRIADAIWRLEL